MSTLLKLLIPAIVIGVLVVTTGYAEAQNVLPTSGLYSLKKIWEVATVTLAVSPETKTLALLNQARTRRSEAKALAAQAKINPGLSPFVANAVSDSEITLTAAQTEATAVSDPDKKKALETQIEQEITDTEQEITGDIEPQAQLQNDDRTKIDQAKTGLAKLQTDASGSD